MVSCEEIRKYYPGQVRYSKSGLVTIRMLGGVVFYAMRRFRNKHAANLYAEDLRECGFRARIINETAFGSAYKYGVYARKK